MIKNKLDLIPDCNGRPMIPETESASLITKRDPSRAESKCGHVRRFSTGNFGSVNSLSCYLAASTGSCHDKCKYGERQDLETKAPKGPVSGKRVEKKGTSQENDITIALAERKTKSGASFKPASVSRTQNTVVLSKTQVSSKPMSSKSSILQMKKNSSGKEGGDELHERRGNFLLSPRKASSGKEHRKHTSIKEMKTSVSDEEKIGARGTISLSDLSSVKKVLTPKHADTRVSSEKLKSLKGASRPKGSSAVGKAERERPSNKYHETDSKRTAVNAKVDLKNSLMKGEAISAKGEGSTVEKATHRKVKAIEQFPDISSPRKLKSRRRLSDSQIGEVNTFESNFKNTEIHAVDGENSVTKFESEKVLLNHQDIEEKKMQSLLNNMIEEMANKITETEKGKVKALISAFETLIYL